jgi:hypothetical protein
MVNFTENNDYLHPYEAEDLLVEPSAKTGAADPRQSSPKRSNADESDGVEPAGLQFLLTAAAMLLVAIGHPHHAVRISRTSREWRRCWTR